MNWIYARQPALAVHIREVLSLLQVKFVFTLKSFNLGLFLISFAFWSKEKKEIENQPRLNQN